jgi:succinoglycan biosynthesis protein ExoM
MQLAKNMSNAENTKILKMRNICVCICTFKRPELLKRLLSELGTQETGNLFTYSILVVDNDKGRSAEPVVADFRRASSIPIQYHIEPRQNIGLARNKAVAHCASELLAFLDDDEFPTSQWLRLLLNACDKYDVDGVLGPVKRHFDEPPPKWVLKGGFYDRPVRPTGSIVHWTEGRTGNVLLRTSVFSGCSVPFNPDFRGGEDTDFFRRMIEQGYRFVWSAEAVAFEVVPPLRWQRSFLLRRALLRGATTLNHPTFGVRDIAKSLFAIPAYVIALPFTLFWGQHKFMNLLVRLFDHLGKILAVFGFNPVKEHYVTE